MSISEQRTVGKNPTSLLGYLPIGNHIMGFLLPSTSHRTELRKALRDYHAIASVNKKIYRIYSKQPTYLKQKEIHYFVKKYHTYQSLYEDPYIDKETGEVFDGNGPPQLYDALLSGCKLPLAASSCSKYTQEIEKDIKRIVQIMPESLKCNIGQLRCRIEVNPLAAAFYNQNIPMRVIEFLLRSGLDPRSKIRLNGHLISTMRDMQSSGLNERFAKVQKIIRKIYEGNIEEKKVTKDQAK